MLRRRELAGNELRRTRRGGKRANWRLVRRLPADPKTKAANWPRPGGYDPFSERRYPKASQLAQIEHTSKPTGKAWSG